ncbi:helix-turn-helix domain-containing protein [Tuanshanicoccus lijuaniae]|uniref:AraC family transcriptional regulator n=1 Tax=Aerococcaceae bacterium zg-1292 TaxID=2774330 RepID=UPI001935279E|nr:helix-turn-helix domain-containing protein [Aerococcaceae bacterium zg-1292]MBF6625130.1 helix-turn-helix domain-containing protein [Aerococcaceae bacterium zg-BR9]MBF6978258.1 helix-turn-helix domain-containing protein [Aerococcaceae bacterium zg-BR22]MBS4456473.1 helix-turn-helix domain-containing protein [Aerococcaceae bacterium zg-A91]MBS4458323.1 helix-turn-helix domain-containing protein [Aerococcaceae bacterium zg-BR33]
MRNDDHLVSIQREEEEYFANQTIPHSFSIAYESVDSPTEPILHKYARFWYITSGEAIFIIQNKRIVLQAGDLVGILPWQCTEIAEVHVPLEFYVIVYEYDLINGILKSNAILLNGHIDFSNAIETNFRVPLDEKGKELIQYIIDLMSVELDGGEYHDSVFQEISALTVANAIVQLILYFVKANLQNMKVEDDHHFIDFVDDNIKMFHYIYAHLNDKVTLRDVAETFYMSESSVSKYINETTGLNFTNLITTMKIARLMNMLHYSDKTLGELAVYLGYVDAAHISTFFKSKTGHNINEFKKLWRQNNNSHAAIKRVPDLLSYIVQHSNQSLEKEELAIKFDIPVYIFNSIFETYTGREFHDFINYIRIIRATERLMTTDESIANIAYDAGFQTTKTFNRNFKKYYGHSPSEFRKLFAFQSNLLS